MAIVYYPNRIYKGKVPAIDRVMAKRDPLMIAGSQNVASTALSSIISMDNNWQIDSLSFTFSNTNSRNFTAFIMNGRKIVENLNDYLWFSTPNTVPQRIVLAPGFYTGTELATELQAKLNANAVYVAAAISFSVVYDDASGIYTVTPTSGSIRYLNVNTSQVLPLRDSIAGHLFGFNADSAFSANVMSDTVVFGLDTEVAIVSQVANTDLSYLHTDIHTMTVDQAVYLTSNTGANVSIGYMVIYEEII